MKVVETCWLPGKPDVVLETSKHLPVGVGRPTRDSWNRHRPDVARTHLMLRSGDETTRLLTALRADAPEWLRRQRIAVDAFRDGVLRTHKRHLTGKQRDLAEFLDVDG